MARYQKKEFCACGAKTMPHRNVCQDCFRIQNTEAVRRNRERQRKCSVVIDELPYITTVSTEPTVMPKFERYRIGY